MNLTLCGNNNIQFMRYMDIIQWASNFCYLQRRMLLNGSLREVADGEECKEAGDSLVSLLQAGHFVAESAEFIICFHLAMQLRHHLPYLHIRTFSLQHLYFPPAISTNSRKLRNSKLNLHYPTLRLPSPHHLTEPTPPKCTEFSEHQVLKFQIHHFEAKMHVDNIKSQKVLLHALFFSDGNS